MTNLPRLELTEDPNKKNDFIIFRKKLKGKKIIKVFSSNKISHNKTHRYNQKTHKKTKKHKKRKSIFNIF